MKSIRIKRQFEPNFMEWFANKQRGWKRQTLAHIGLNLLFAPMLFVFPWQVYALFILSLYFHELGHAFVFWLSGIKPSILAVFPLAMGVIASTEEENKEAEHWPYWRLALSVLGGPSATLFLILFGAFLSGASVDRQFAQYGELLFYLNILILALNFIPFWHSDAGVLFKLIIYSFDQQPQLRVKAMMIVAFCCVTAVLLVGLVRVDAEVVLHYLRTFSPIIPVILLFVVMSWFWGRKKPFVAKTNVKLLSAWQMIATLFAYFSIVIIALASW